MTQGKGGKPRVKDRAPKKKQAEQKRGRKKQKDAAAAEDIKTGI